MRRDPLSGVAIGTDKKPPPLGVVVHLILDEEKNTEKVEIDSLDDIYEYKEKLRQTVQFYE